MKSICVAVQAFFLVFVATIVLAAAPDPGPTGADHPAWGGMHKGHSHFGAMLGLSKEQKEKMRELRIRQQDATRDLKYDLAMKALEMKKLYTDPKTDDTTLLAKQKEVQAVLFKLIEKRGEAKIEFRKILTPEQIKKLDRMPMGIGMGMFMGPGMGMEGGPGMGPHQMDPGMDH